MCLVFVFEGPWDLEGPGATGELPRQYGCVLRLDFPRVDRREQKGDGWLAKEGLPKICFRGLSSRAPSLGLERRKKVAVPTHAIHTRLFRRGF